MYHALDEVPGPLAVFVLVGIVSPQRPLYACHQFGLSPAAALSPVSPRVAYRVGLYFAHILRLAWVQSVARSPDVVPSARWMSPPLVSFTTGRVMT